MPITAITRPVNSLELVVPLQLLIDGLAELWPRLGGHVGHVLLGMLSKGWLADLVGVRTGVSYGTSGAGFGVDLSTGTVMLPSSTKVKL